MPKTLRFLIFILIIILNSATVISAASPEPTTEYIPYRGRSSQSSESTVSVSADQSNPEKNTDLAAKKTTSLRELAFKDLLDQTFPLTPEQIILIKKAQDDAQRASATSPTPPPKPQSSTITVSLAPGATPPLVRLGAGFVSSLVFADSTGQAWPVSDYSLGNPTDFNIQWDKKSNTLFVQSLKPYATANLAVRLTTLDTPIMLTLVSSQKIIDYRLDLQISGRGPNTLHTLPSNNIDLSQLNPAVSTELIHTLDGIPPQNSIILPINLAYGQAWRTIDNRILFRTTLRVLSPAWQAQVQSPDGMRVYALNLTPLILATDPEQGKTIQIYLNDPKTRGSHSTYG
jgi:intracellular multiplication protein IcmK